jgi:CHASE1-domain containing sensor protein
LIKRCNFVFDQFNELAVGERISTSRALSKYAMVQQNTSKNRFKVKKDKNFAPAYLSARKIIFQVK